MNYQTYLPHPDLAPLVKCYWTLEIPTTHSASKQRIIPDGCIEMAFLLGDDIRRYVSDAEFILQPRTMVLGKPSPLFTSSLPAMSIPLRSGSTLMALPIS